MWIEYLVEIKQLRTELAAVKAERDKLREWQRRAKDLICAMKGVRRVIGPELCTGCYQILDETEELLDVSELAKLLTEVEGT
jgi:hypothetical protein